MRNTILCLLIFLVPAGFYAKAYSGPFSDWVNNSFSGILYELFWCFLVLLVLPTARPLGIAVWVFSVTAALEILQLWRPPFLQAVRSTFIGRTLIGTSFVWSDFIYYFIGCGTGLLVMNRMKRGNTSCDVPST
jgi:hypothetical protein